MRDDYFVRNVPWCLYAAASCALATTAILRAEKSCPSLLSFLSFFLFSSFLLSFNGILVSGGVNYAFNDSNSRKVDLFFSLFSSCLSTFPSYILPFSSSSLKNDGNLKIGFDPRPATLHF